MRTSAPLIIYRRTFAPRLKKGIGSQTPINKSMNTKFGFDWPSGFRGDVLTCGLAKNDRRMPDHGYIISSPGEPMAQVS